MIVLEFQNNALWGIKRNPLTQLPLPDILILTFNENVSLLLSGSHKELLALSTLEKSTTLHHTKKKTRLLKFSGRKKRRKQSYLVQRHFVVCSEPEGLSLYDLS